MNNNKKNNNNGWILCPSKSFPGKFYYFNVVSGEAAWSLNELDKKSLKNDCGTPRMSDAFNHYPEPNSPPVANDEIHNNTDASYKLRPTCNSMTEQWIPQSQMCSQVLFPKYLPSHPSTYIPNVMWTPLPMSTQIFIRDTPEARKQMSDQITQTQELRESTIVQTSGMSLSDRFLSYYSSNNKLNFNDNIKPSRDNNCNKIKNFHKCCINDTELINLQCTQRFPPLETEMQSVENGSTGKCHLNKKPEHANKTVSYKDDNKISASFECSSEIKKIKLDPSMDCTGTQTLDPSDLRLLLLAKKKNNLNVQDTFNKFKGDRRNNVCIERKSAPKKQVTFDLSNCDSSKSAFKYTLNKNNKQKDVVQTMSSNQKPISADVNIHTLKSLKKARMRTDVWFIMADLNVLLDDFEFVENFVKQDQSCQLVIPHAVLTIIRELSTLTQNGSKTVMVSRKIIRRLSDSPRHISLLESVRDVNVSISRQILDCSIKLLERNFHVVLITTDVELLANAKAVNLPCYMLEQINGNTERRCTLNDGNKDIFHSRNDVHDGGIENLFLKKPNEFQQFVLDNKPETLDNKSEKIQYINSDNVKNFKRVIKNDVCTETTYIDSNSARIPNVINANQLINSYRNVNMEKSKYMTLNRTVCNDVDKGLKPMNGPGKNLNIQFNSEVLKEKLKRLVNIKEVTQDNTDLSDKNKVRNDENQSKCIPGQKQIALDGGVGEKIVSRQPDLNACSNKHESVSESNGNKDLNLSKKSEENSLYDKLKRFYIKNKVMADRIISRGDEWICCFTQIMENVMSHILWDKSTTKFTSPCTILEATDYIAKMFGDNKSVETAAYGLCAMYNLIHPNGKLKRDVHPNDILNMIGCGVLLVESLKEAIPHSSQLLETEHSLMHLLLCIEDPSSDPNTYEFKNSPTVSRFDVDEDITEPKYTYVKKPSEVLMYLKKHFPEWRTYTGECSSKNDESNRILGKSLTVVRTTGRHLNLLKINNVNKLTLSRNVSRDDKITITKQNDTENARPNGTLTESESVNVNKNFTSDSERETKSVEVEDFDHLTKHNNTFFTSPQINNGPSVIRNVGIIECFENKLKSKSLDDTLRNSKKVYNTLDEDSKSKNMDAISETFTDVAYQTEVNNSDSANDKITANVRTVTSDISYDDSGLGNENCLAHTTIKSFLIELSSSLKAIYKYLNDSNLEIKQKGVQEHNKKAIHDKTDKTYKVLLLIVDKLKRIIEREPDEDGATVKSLLIKAGVDVANDKRISRYKQVVTKCLEQAYLLKRGLKLLLFVTGDNHDSASVISEPDQSYVCHFNIFE